MTYSAIRIADVFYLRRDPNRPIDEQGIPMAVLVMGKTKAEDRIERSVQLTLKRPNGLVVEVGDPLRAIFNPVMKDDGIALLAEGSKLSDIAGGFTIRAEKSIVPRQIGRHQFDVFLDGDLVARTPFTILELRSHAAD